MTYTNITRVGTDHTIWLKGLEFYKDELDVQEKRLSEIASRNNSLEARQAIEHFQNQFIVQRSNISSLRHEVNNYVRRLGTDSKEHSGHIETEMLNKHLELQDKYERFEMIMNGLRGEFKSFLLKWI